MKPYKGEKLVGSKGAQAGRRCVEQLQIMSQRSGGGLALCRRLILRTHAPLARQINPTISLAYRDPNCQQFVAYRGVEIFSL